MKDNNKNYDFIVKIKDNQHNTWQGSIEWISEKKEVPFRSALELIKLIDSVVKNEDE